MRLCYIGNKTWNQEQSIYKKIEINNQYKHNFQLLIIMYIRYKFKNYHDITQISTNLTPDVKLIEQKVIESVTVFENYYL